MKSKYEIEFEDATELHSRSGDFHTEVYVLWLEKLLDTMSSEYIANAIINRKVNPWHV